MTSSADKTGIFHPVNKSFVEDTKRPVRQRILINRPVFDQMTFDEIFVNGDEANTARSATAVSTVKKFASGIMKNFGCRETGHRQRINSPKSSALGGVGRKALGLVPVVRHLSKYQWRKWLINDVVSGISTGVIHVPQGMGFALLAGLPPAYGLYTSVFPGWIYYVFGTSRHLSMGTMALTALMVGAVINRELDASNITARLSQTAASGNATSIGDFTVAPGESGFVWDNVDDVTRSSFTDWTTSSSMSGTMTSGNTDEEINYKVGIAVSVTLIAGLFQLLMYVCRLGVIATYMSSPFIGGFMTGSAVQIIVAQIPFQLGISFRRPSGMFEMPLTVFEICRHLADTNIAALITSLISIGFLVGVKDCINERFKTRLKVPVPAELILVIISTTIVHFAGLFARFGLAVIGRIPTGLPSPRLPPFNGNPVNYIGDGVILAVIAFAIAISMAKLMAERHRYDIDIGQELLACGLQNSVSSFFGCFVSTQAPPRTLLHETTGCRTQLAGLVATIIPLLVTLCIGPLFESLPVAVLGSIISIALLPLIRQAPADLRRLWNVDRVDLVVWTITFLVTAFASVTAGLIGGISLAIVLTVVRGQLTVGVRLVQAAGTEIYVERRQSTDDDFEQSTSVTSSKSETREQVASSTTDCQGEQSLGNGEPTTISLKNDKSSGVVACFRFGMSICFANADRFRQQLYATTVNPVFLAKYIAKRQKRIGTKLPDGSGGGGDTDGNLIVSKSEHYTKTSSCCLARNHHVKEQRQGSAKLLSNGRQEKSSAIEDATAAEMRPMSATTDDGRIKVSAPEMINVKSDNDVLKDLSTTPLGVKNSLDVEKGENSDANIVNEQSLVSSVVIDCSSINYVDTTGLGVIKQILHDYAAVDIAVALAGCNKDLIRRLEIAGLLNQKVQLTEKETGVNGNTSNETAAKLATSKGFHVYPSVHDAVMASNRGSVR